MSRKRMSRFLMGGLFIALLLAVACGPAATPEPAEPAAPEPAEPAPAAPEPVAPEPAAPATPQPAAPAATAQPAPTAPSAAPEPAATTPPQATTEQPTGNLVVAVITVGTASGNPRDCPFCNTIPLVSAQDTLVGAARAQDGSLIAEPLIAESWELGPDGTYTDFTIREGINFNQDWGQLTAEDVAFTFNIANPNTTPGAIHDTGGDLVADLESVEVIDPQTARFNWLQYGEYSVGKFTGDVHEGIGIFSKKAADEMGDEWLRDNIIGSGPFEITDWTQFQGITLQARPDHWRKTPYVQTVSLREVPESSSRRAMLETGEAQIANIEVIDWVPMTEAGFARAKESTNVGINILFSGNYWESQHPVSGEPLERPLDTASHPWIGDPYELGPEFNPDTPSMQNAEKVRWAMSLDIDRESLNNAILGGLGEVTYLNGISVNDPIYQANVDNWAVPYDPAQAKQLMEEAGYPDGFEAEAYVRPEGIQVEASEAIASYWLSDLGINVQFDRQAYATFRPTLIGRTAHLIRFDFGGGAPSTWPNMWTHSATAAPGGYNAGFELPMATETVEKIYAAKDPDAVRQVVTDWFNYMHETQLNISTVELPISAWFDPDSIVEEDWQMKPGTHYDAMAGVGRSLEFVRLEP